MSEYDKNKIEEEHRKLAAIMFTDMVGYSSLTQKNESLALKLLKEHRKILRDIFPRYNGNEIETVGDAFFVEFDSALAAANCAVEIQKTLFERNKISNTEVQIQLRIGLHIGDVVHIGKNVHGDGVNIAARLEPLAKPSGICLSEDVERQIVNKFSLPITKMKRQKLKNIDQPINIYSIELPWEKDEKYKSGKMKPHSFKRTVFVFSLLVIIVISVFIVFDLLKTDTTSRSNKRIAVLPFVDISKNSDDEYFADGMTEELISDLAKIGGLDVIARTSIMKYKDVKMDVAEIGSELNVGTVLEGSIRKYLDNIRITVQLIDVESQRHLWAQDYNNKLDDVFKIQTDIAEKVAGELRIQLLANERENLSRTGTENFEAYRFYLLGRHNLNKRSRETIQNALEYFNQAIDLEPNYPMAYSGLADCYTLIGAAGYGDMDHLEAISKAKESAIKALELDNKLSEAYTSLAYITFRIDWEWNEAERLFRKAIELKPGYSIAHEWYGLFLTVQGRNDEALKQMLKAEELDPLSPSVRNGVGRVYEYSKHYEKAIEKFNKIIRTDPNFAEAHAGLGSCYFHYGDYDESIAEMNEAMKLSGGRNIIKAAIGYIYAYTGKKKEAEQMLKEFQETKVSPVFQAFIYTGLGEKENAINNLYEGYKKRESGLIYSKILWIFDSLREDKKFKELLKLIGLE